MFKYLMYIFEVQMCMFGYLKTPDIILSLVSSQKLDWTHTFDTHCNCLLLVNHLYVSLLAQSTPFYTSLFIVYSLYISLN